MDKYALIDADIEAYRAASRHQKKTPFGTSIDIPNAIASIDQRLTWYSEFLNAQTIVCLSDPTKNYFRKDLLPSYKENRVAVEKPLMLDELKSHLAVNYKSYVRPKLEADDVMGILSTSPDLLKGKKVIVSVDKDMETIPGWWFNPDKHKKPVKVSEYDADYAWMYQTLTGDATDNYKGCYRIGSIKAKKELKGLKDIHEMWDVVLGLFWRACQTEDEAIVQARMARILRHTDYDFKNKEVKPWTSLMA